MFETTSDFVWQAIQPRPRDAHKGTFGSVLAVAGSASYRGAAALAVEGALRTGAGIVTLASVEPVLAAVAARLPECCLCPCKAGAEGGISPQNIEHIRRQMASVLLAGPGLGYTAQSAARAAETRTQVKTLLPSYSGRAKLDADDLNTAKTLLKLAAFLAIPIGLIFAEPDLSTTICICATLFIVIFIAGLSLKIIGIAVLILIPFFGGFFWYIQQDNLPQFLNGYQSQRKLGHMYGGGSTQDQQNNSIMAIGSGQLTGKGINSSDVATVKDTNLISEQQTDFIFSAVGEELGFIGSVIIIAILLLIVLQCIRVARRSGDNKGMYIATGMAALVSIQSFINIGVATSILPNTGLPLPFISYGLSSLVSLCAGMGMVLNINLQKKKY